MPEASLHLPGGRARLRNAPPAGPASARGWHCAHAPWQRGPRRLRAALAALLACSGGRRARPRGPSKMAAQRRSLLQSVRNRPALRAGGWESGGGGGCWGWLSGAGAAVSSPGAAYLSLAECDRRLALSRAGPPHCPRTGARAHCGPGRPGLGRRGLDRPSVAGTSRRAVPEPEGKVASGGAAELPWGDGNRGSSSPLGTAYSIQASRPPREIGAVVIPVLQTRKQAQGGIILAAPPASVAPFF